MKKTKKRKWIILSIIVLGVISMIIVVPFINNPLQKSPNRIRDDILKITPVGLSMDEVRTVIGEQNWRVAEGSSEHGYRNHNHPAGQRVGVKYIGADVGKSRFLFFFQTVRVYWGFDENDKLIDVYAVKHLDI
jgi:uncharacterized SAM-binding protein YcdF (DUF218 family)